MHSELAAAFDLLNTELTHNQDLWRPQPFITRELPWRKTHPQLYTALLDLTEAQAQQLHDEPFSRIDWFRQQQLPCCDALDAIDPPQATSIHNIVPDHYASADVPGRKLEQITAFAGALPHYRLPLVDWCAGKGHLSRSVQRCQQQRVYCLEWNAALVAKGESLSRKQQLDTHYYHHDVRQELPAVCSDSEKVHIGLHACGELHHHLLRHVVNTGARAVALSPCCYHKVSGDFYRPLSRTAAKSQLLLNRAELHLAVQETVTARSGERRLRERERLWRLGFDALQRTVRGVDDYLNVPSCKRELLRGDFPGFCRWAAGNRQIELPEIIDYDHYLQLGRLRQREIVRLELLRQVFKRPLELWLVLDGALYLEEQGYRVDVTQFCERNVSPRNLLLQAHRPG